MSETAEEATLDDVAQSVSQLSTAVEGMKAGLVDRETVEQIAAAAVQAAGQTTGYRPDPVAVDGEGNPIDVERAVLGADPRERFANILGLPAKQTAPVLRREVEAVEQFRARADDLVLLSAVMMGQGTIKSPLETGFYASHFLPSMHAAVDTQTAGEGAEFVPRQLSSQLIERISLQLQVLNLFPEVTMPTQPFDIPARATSRTRGGRHTEQTADTGQTAIKKITAGSRKITLTAAKFATEILVSKEAEEDAIIAVLPFLQAELEEFTAADLEDAAINGDTTGTHRDADVTASDDPRKNWVGLRKLANANTAERDHGGGDLTVAGLRGNRKLMGKYGINPSNLAHIIGMNSYIDILSDTNVQTVDKYGANATLLSGELARADGAPVIVSEFARNGLNATGVQDGVTTTRTVALTVHQRAMLRGTRRALTVEFLRELYSEFDQDGIKVSTRQALSARYGTDKTVAASYNVDGT